MGDSTAQRGCSSPKTFGTLRRRKENFPCSLLSAHASLIRMSMALSKMEYLKNLILELSKVQIIGEDFRLCESFEFMRAWTFSGLCPTFHETAIPIQSSLLRNFNYMVEVCFGFHEIFERAEQFCFVLIWKCNGSDFQSNHAFIIFQGRYTAHKNTRKKTILMIPK